MTGAFVPHNLAHPISGKPSGRLSGLTAAVKDMYDIKGERTGGGSPEWLHAHPHAHKNSACVQLLLDAGAEIIGKTICDEFFFSLSGANAHYGTPTNPRAPDRMPGGSSSGSAVAVASGECDFALGSDTGGSIRVPASFCGIYGLRPTHGRTDLTGAMAMAPTFDTAGWFASNPEVLRKVGTVLLKGETKKEKVARVLIATDALRECDDSVAALCRGFLQRVVAVLPAPEEMTLSKNGFDDWRQCFRVIQGREIWSIYGEWIKSRKPALGPGVRERMAYAATVSAEECAAARQALIRARAHIRVRIPAGTVLALPTAPSIAPKLDIDAAGLDKFRSRAMALTCIAGVSGLPQVAIPIGSVEGCPVGLSFIGWAGGDESLLDLAVSLAPHCGIAREAPRLSLV